MRWESGRPEVAQPIDDIGGFFSQNGEKIDERISRHGGSLLTRLPQKVSNMETKYFLRINTPLSKPITDFFTKYEVSKALVMAHKGTVGENPHIHAVFILRKGCTRQCLAQRIKNYFGVTGNGSYSLKQWDGQNKGAGSYMFHEDNKIPELNINFTDGEIQEMIDHNAVVATRVQKVLKDPYRLTIRDIHHASDQGQYIDEYVIGMRYLYNLVKVCKRSYPGKHLFENRVETLKLMIHKSAKSELDSYHHLVSQSYSQSKPLASWVIQCPQEPAVPDAPLDDAPLGDVLLDDEELSVE